MAYLCYVFSYMLCGSVWRSFVRFDSMKDALHTWVRSAITAGSAWKHNRTGVGAAGTGGQKVGGGGTGAQKAVLAHPGGVC